MSDEKDQRKLQELLSAARSALEEALDHAEKHDLWFEFSGIRRGPGGEMRTVNVNDPDEVADLRGDEYLESTSVDVLNLVDEWVGSWC